MLCTFLLHILGMHTILMRDFPIYKNTINIRVALKIIELPHVQSEMSFTTCKQMLVDIPMLYSP